MNKKIGTLLLATASLFMASCGSKIDSSSSSSSMTPETSSELPAFKASKALRYLDIDLQDIAECDNAGWYYKPLETLDYDIYADVMMKATEDEEVTETDTSSESASTVSDSLDESASQEDSSEEETYVYNPDDWTALGIGLDVENGSLMLNGRTSEDITGLTGELIMNECKLWEISDGVETYQKVSGVKGYLDGATSSLYADLSNASLLRLALIELVRQAYPDNSEWSIGSKTKITIDDNALTLLKLLTPWSNRSASVYSKLVDTIKSDYGTDGTDYCYFDNAKVKTGYYLNWIVNDVATLEDMADDIIGGTSYPTFAKDYIKKLLASYTDYIDDFKMSIGISWTQDELRSFNLAVQAKLDEDKITAKLTSDDSIYIKSLSFEGKFMPMVDSAAEFDLPDLAKYDEMPEIVGLTDQEIFPDYSGGSTGDETIDSYLERIKQWIEENGGDTGDWDIPGGDDGDDDWRTKVDDWLSSMIG